jgi:hypothetical protein
LIEAENTEDFLLYSSLLNMIYSTGKNFKKRGNLFLAKLMLKRKQYKHPDIDTILSRSKTLHREFKYICSNVHLEKLKEAIDTSVDSLSTSSQECINTKREYI